MKELRRVFSKLNETGGGLSENKTLSVNSTHECLSRWFADKKHTFRFSLHMRGDVSKYSGVVVAVSAAESRRDVVISARKGFLSFSTVGPIVLK